MNPVSRPANITLFGVPVATPFKFAAPMVACREQAQLRFHLEAAQSGPRPPTLAEPVYQSPAWPEGSKGVLTVRRAADYLSVGFSSVGFEVRAEQIIARSPQEISPAVVEVGFLGPVLALWLEVYRGVPALHASAVANAGRAVAFLSGGCGGKTTLAASMVQAGFSLLSDDILALKPEEGEVRGQPGYPQMRMWPREAEHFLGTADGLNRVRPELEKLRVPVKTLSNKGFCASSQRLVCLYSIDWTRDREAEIEITPLRPAVAVVELLRQSFAARPLSSLGLDNRRMEILAGVVSSVPVRRLSYPAGFGHLGRVVEAIVQDMRSLT